MNSLLPDCLARIDAFLTTKCQLVRSDTAIARPSGADSATTAPQRTFRLGATSTDGGLAKLRLLVDQHHKIELHGVVDDRRLGSLGLIHVLNAADAATSDEGTLTRIVQEAAHLRHLLGLHRMERPDPMAWHLPAIEVVVLIVGEDVRTAEVVGKLRGILRRILRETGLLHSLSINLARLPAAPGPEEDRSLARAFCWLLPECSAWYAKNATTPGEPAARTAWDGLELENFRNAEPRRWHKDRSARLHVVHGPNGSGKSTLAEGFEYAVTGHSTRLAPANPTTDPAQHYRPLIFRDASTAPTKVRLLRDSVTGNGAPPKPEVLLERPVPPAPPDATERRPNGRSLRMDQELCDQLVRAHPTVRARTWLETFFGEANQIRTRRRDAVASQRAAIQALLPDLPETTVDPTAGQSRDAALVWLKDGSAELSTLLAPVLGPELLKALPSLESFGLQLPGALRFRTKLEHGDWSTAQQAGLTQQLHPALKHDLELLGSWAETDTEPLRQLLERLGRDVFDGSEARPALDPAERRDLFNRWLRRVALVDLHEKALVIARTREALDELSAEPLETIAPRASAEELGRERDRLRQERDGLRQRLASLPSEGGAGPASGESRRVPMTEVEPLLTAVSRGALAPVLDANQADALRDLLDNRRAERLGSLQVGSDRWTEPLLNLLEQRRRLLELRPRTLLQPDPETTATRATRASRAAKVRAEALCQLIAASLKHALADQDSAARFVRQIESGELGAPLDELVALLTPARWAYDPIQTKLDLSGRTEATVEQLEFRTYDLDAAAILNTAELNTLALAIYLLCAPRVDNPYRVIFLDDPLQNMDELTVASVARGFARLMRQWSGVDSLRDWDVVLLLHSETDTEQVLLEAPAAHYRIPWLAPRKASLPRAEDRRPIEAEPRSASQLLPLHDLLEDVTAGAVAKS